MSENLDVKEEGCGVQNMQTIHCFCFCVFSLQDLTLRYSPAINCIHAREAAVQVLLPEWETWQVGPYCPKRMKRILVTLFIFTPLGPG